MIRNIRIFFFQELPLWLAWITTAIFVVFDLSGLFLTNLTHPFSFAVLFLWLFLMVLWNAFEVSHHVESLAKTLGEPFSTLILTLTVISIEVVTIGSIMLSGNSNPTLARDTMYAIIMIVLNGIVGLSLLLGGIRYHEQRYNLRGSMNFLSVVLVLAVIGLVLPNFTQSTAQSTFSMSQTVFLIVTSLLIYGIFLAIQTVSHRSQFVFPDPVNPSHPNSLEIHAEDSKKTSKYHAILLVAYLIPTLILAKQIAIPIESTLSVLGPPPALGGLLVAILVLSPEAVSAIRFSLKNQLQHSVNIALGSVLATTALTIPAVLAIGLLTGQNIVLGLQMKNVVLLLLSLVISIITFASGRTNILQGALHLLLFLAYVLLIFD